MKMMKMMASDKARKLNQHHTGRTFQPISCETRRGFSVQSHFFPNLTNLEHSIIQTFFSLKLMSKRFIFFFLLFFLFVFILLLLQQTPMWEQTSLDTVQHLRGEQMRFFSFSSREKKPACSSCCWNFLCLFFN